MRASEIYPEPEDFDSIPKGRRIPREYALALAGKLGYWKRQYRSDYVVGCNVQKRLMPLSREASHGIGSLGHSGSEHLAWTLCLSQSEVLSGVYANIVEIEDGRFAFIFSEASGRRSSAAALLSAYVAGLFESHIAERASTLTPEGMATLLERINENIEQKDIPGQFISVLLGLVDANEQILTLSAAAACPPILWRSASRSAELMQLPEAPAAGTFPLEMIASRGHSFAPFPVSFLPGDLFLVGGIELSGSTKPQEDDDYENPKYFGNERILRIMDAVMRREKIELDLRLTSGERLEFDFSSVADPTTDAPLALASAEAIFQQNDLAQVRDPALADFLRRTCPRFRELPQSAAVSELFPTDRQSYAILAFSLNPK